MKDSILDVEASIKITLQEAREGCTKKIKINDDAPINLTIPPGIQNGKILRINGKGNYQPATGRRGNLYIKLQIDGHEEVIEISTSKTSNAPQAKTVPNRNFKVYAFVAVLVAVSASTAILMETERNPDSPKNQIENSSITTENNTNSAPNSDTENSPIETPSTQNTNSYQRESAGPNDLTAIFPNPCSGSEFGSDGHACMQRNGFITLGGWYVKQESRDENGVEYQVAEYSSSPVKGKYADCVNQIDYNRTHSGRIGGGVQMTEKKVAFYVCKMFF
jgi:hypothetical protein